MPAGSDDVVIVKPGGLIVTDKTAVVEFAPRSLARTVKLPDPAAPGVPDIVPFAARFNPGGSDPLATVHV